MGAVLHADADFLDEKTELVDAVSDLAEGTILKVGDSLGHVSDERVDVLDACVEVFDMLNLKSTNQETVDELGHFDSRSTHKVNSSDSFALSVIFTILRIMITASSPMLSCGLSGQKAKSEVFHA